MRYSHSRALAFAAAILGIGIPCLGWDAHGHRTVTLLALDRLPPDSPAWMREPEIRARIADQANEPDRWRGTRLAPIQHEANPEHYINIEDLEPFGLSLGELPRHRYEAFRTMVLAREKNPRAFAPVRDDPDKYKEWPGFLPWAIQEHHAKLQSAFGSYRILEEINDPARAGQLEQAKQNVIYHMGVLSHFVGDAAQPLHTTRHHHGWKGPNPHGYSTQFGIHAFIDGAILRIHGLDYGTLRPMMPEMQPPPTDGPRDAWEIALGGIERSFAQVEMLYRLDKDGTMRQEAGRNFIAERLCDAGATLADLYNSAWQGSEPTERDISAFIKFSDLRPRRGADPAPAPDPSEP
jgi:hypothetical protein